MANSDSQVPGSALENDLEARVSENMAHTIARLGDLVRIPSVSWEGRDPILLDQSADRVRELFAATGVFDRVGVFTHETDEGDDGRPSVIAVRSAKPGFPTVTLYAHHDVQPEGDAALWDTPAFEPTLKGDRLYGRGASDDKAGVIAHVAAIEAVRDALGDDFGVGVNVFIEGEEESGSGSFRNTLRAHLDDLKADAIIVADSDNPSVTVPGLTVSLRGNVAFDLHVRTLEHAWHSGMFGGAVPDAMLATIKLLSTLWDDAGSVAVAGLRTHDAPVPERDADEYRADADLLDGVQLIGSGPVLSRVWNQPAITITGIDAPDVANASNTLLPSVRVHVSCRIAPGQTAEDAVRAIEEHLRSHAPFGAAIEIENLSAGSPFLANTDGEAVTVMRESMRDGWGTDPELTGIGGSIPFITDFLEMIPDAEILVTGVEDPLTMAHSPNESQHLGVLRRAILSEALFLVRMNARGRSAGVAGD